VCAQWNGQVVQALVDGARQRLRDHHQVEDDLIVTIVIPGSYELPLAASRCLSQGAKGVIAIGCLIQGSTPQQVPYSTLTAPCMETTRTLLYSCSPSFKFIAEAVSHGLMRVGLDHQKPVIFGVLTCLNMEQAMERAGLGNKSMPNHGILWADALMAML
jgi:6,7-dimethyl-8-ribityllumazine synthase